MKKLVRLYNAIIAPITSNSIYFIWCFLLLLAPSIVYWLKSPLDFLHIKYILLALPVCFWSAYICVAITCSTYMLLFKWISIIILILFASIECFLLCFFGTAVSEVILHLILGTNSNEIDGFIRQYLLTLDFIKYIIALLIVIFVIIFSIRIFKHLRISNAGRVIIFPILIFSCFLNIYRDVRFVSILSSSDVQKIRTEIDLLHYSKNYTTFGRIIYSSRMIYILLKDISKLEDTLSRDITVSCSFNSSNIVVIVGESFNKFHSSLYGYKLPTNPLLEQEKYTGNLYVFDDVVTPFNKTYRVLKSIFSFESQDVDIKWTSYPLFPAIFKAAGFDVRFISNQEVESVNTSAFDLYNNYLVDSRISRYLFDYMNTTKYMYDGDLVRNNIISESDSLFNTLTIYHLLGQHMNYSSRYTDEYEVFNLSDYSSREELNDFSKLVVAEYDNATLYNDSVIKDILDLYRNEDVIILYFADHGEEVYDFRNRVGRDHEELIIPQRAKYEYSIPFMIWMSDKYRINHPEIVDVIYNSQKNPFMIDDLPHLLLDLAGIDYSAFDPSRSLINPL